MKNFRLFWTLLLSIALLPLTGAFANTGPVLTRLKPENNITDTITIVKGQTIVFHVLGTDADGNMRGIEWYNNAFIGADSFTPTGNKEMTKSITFNTTGNYNVACVAFDAVSAYGNGITWKVKVVDFIRTAYVDWSDEIVGTAAAEDSLFNWAQRNNITGLSLYMPTTNMQNHHAELNSFIGRAKTKGINEIGIIIGNGTTDLTAALSYYDDPAVTNKFTGLLTEIEYWGSSNYQAALDAYIQVVTDMKNASNARTPGFKVESYMGGGTSQAEADRLCAVIDKILLVCYTSSTDPSSVYYSYRRGRLQYFLNAAANKNRKVEVVPLFSLEPNFNGGQALSTIDNGFYGGFTTDDGLTNKYLKGILSGSQYFTYYYMNPNKIYVPRQYYHAGVGYPGAAINVELGGTVAFKTEGNDQNGNFTGADWYVNNVLNGQETISPVVDAVVRHNITFNTAGDYTVEARTKDATGYFTPAGYRFQTMVHVTADSVNLAINKTASQSTTDFGAVAGRAVDGNPNSSWAGGSLTHTSVSDPSTQAWWQVDLGAIQNISTVKVFNRTDCCSDRLSNFHIFVSDVPFISNTVAGTQAQPGVLDIPNPGAFSDAGTFVANRTGRYVRIQLVTAGVPLSLAEVKVFQAPASSPMLAPISQTKVEMITPSAQKKIEKIRLYPNPVTSVLNVAVPEKAVMQVISMTGTVLSAPVTVQGPGVATIRTDQLQPGMYLLKVQLNRLQTVLKFVKE